MNKFPTFVPPARLHSIQYSTWSSDTSHLTSFHPNYLGTVCDAPCSDRPTHFLYHPLALALALLLLSPSTRTTFTVAQCLPTVSTFPSRAPSSLSTLPRRSPVCQLSLPRPPSPSSLLTHFFPTDLPPSRATTPSPPSPVSIALPARHLLPPPSLSLHQSLRHRFQLFCRLTQSMRLPRRLLRR